MPTAEEIQQVYDKYMAALVRHDLDGVMAMFAPNAVLHDPVDGPVREGREAIREFFAGGINGIRACRQACPAVASGTPVPVWRDGGDNAIEMRLLPSGQGLRLRILGVVADRSSVHAVRDRADPRRDGVTSTDRRYVWRHLPLNDVHLRAQLAAEASEAAAAQGASWPMHDLLLEHQDQLAPEDLMRYAEQLGLDVKSFADDLASHRWSERIAADVESADVSGVAGTPSFFVNGQRSTAGGCVRPETLSRAVRTARDRNHLDDRP